MPRLPEAKKSGHKAPPTKRTIGFAADYENHGGSLPDGHFDHDGRMSDSVLILCVRLAGAFHFVTLVLACFTPIPTGWSENLAKLPEMHRRFAIAQNISIGATIAVLGLLSVIFAPLLVTGEPLARALCGATALFWGGRACVLPWLGVRPALTSSLLRVGYVLLVAECVIYAAAYTWLAVR